jgi:endonuclease III
VRDEEIHEVMELLSLASGEWDSPAVGRGDPFRVLLACILSLRTHDRTTGPASQRLFELAPDAATLAELLPGEVEQAIYPVGFYRIKAAQIIAIARRLVDDYGGRVPDEIDELLTFNGVGRKSANLTVTLGYGKPGICVDIHVHRICNRLGYVDTGTPDQTERVLRAKLPQQYWLRINELLVMFGQNLCSPVSPRCSICPVARFCPRNGVVNRR